MHDVSLTNGLKAARGLKTTPALAALYGALIVYACLCAFVLVHHYSLGHPLAEMASRRHVVRQNVSESIVGGGQYSLASCVEASDTCIACSGAPYA